jgi:hypothetical protein
VASRSCPYQDCLLRQVSFQTPPVQSTR